LKKIIEHNVNKLSHAYICGPSLVSDLAMAALCSDAKSDNPCGQCANCLKVLKNIHPDIIYVQKTDDKKEIIVDQIRRLKASAIEVPNDAQRKVYIVLNAELMNIQAQNAFLQLLEEPPTHAVFILSTDAPSALLNTVRSRCVKLFALPAHTPEDSGAVELVREFFEALEYGNAALVKFMFRLEKADKETFSSFIRHCRSNISERLRASYNIPAKTGYEEKLSLAEKTLIKAEQMLELNVSTGHIAGLICASLLDN